MRKVKIHSLMALIAAAALCGCVASRSPVTRVGDAAYHVRTTGARYETQADTNLKALAAASAYCGAQSKQLLFRQSTETSEHAWSPKAEDLTFICVGPRDPRYIDAAIRSDAAVIAQQ